MEFVYSDNNNNNIINTTDYDNVNKNIPKGNSISYDLFLAKYNHNSVIDTNKKFVENNSNQ